MRTSPRKRANERAATGTPPTPPPQAKKRAPQRCQVCPNKPLRSQCEHRFRRKKAQVTTSTSLIEAAPSPSSVASGPALHVNSDVYGNQVSGTFPVPGTHAWAGQPPPGVVVVQTVTGGQGSVSMPYVQTPLAPPPPLTFAQLLSQVPVSQTVPPAPVLPPPPSSFVPQAPAAAFPPPSPLNPLGPIPPSVISEPEIPLDPALFSPVPSLASPSTNVEQAQEPALEDEDFALLTEEEEIAPRSSKGKKKKKRVYPSIRNPFCGLVDGVGRGDRAASEEFPRRREMKEPYTDPKIAAKRWDVWMQDLMTRCESISDRSSCWMYIAVQHPSSKFAFAHFTSQKLRREAPQDVATIHKQVSRMMGRVKRADRSQLIECDRQKEEALDRAIEAEERAKAAEERAAKAESETQRLQAEVDARERLLSSLGRCS